MRLFYERNREVVGITSIGAYQDKAKAAIEKNRLFKHRWFRFRRSDGKYLGMDGFSLADKSGHLYLGTESQSEAMLKKNPELQKPEWRRVEVTKSVRKDAK